MAVQAVASTPAREAHGLRAEPDWRKVVRLLHTSRALDEIEETRLVPERKGLYQFSARGHELPQIRLGPQLTDAPAGVRRFYPGMTRAANPPMPGASPWLSAAMHRPRPTASGRP